MIAHRRRDLAARNHHLSSFNPTHRPIRDPGRPEDLEFITRAEGMKVKFDYFGRSQDPRSSGAGEEEFRWLPTIDDDSDIPSPKMGRSPAAPRSPDTSPTRHHQPTVRAQAIARYRQEMMGLVRDVPDSAYELSLKDLVELPRWGRTEEEEEAPLKAPETPERAANERKPAAAKKGTARKVSRSQSLDSGVFLLKMFFPFSFGGKRKIDRSSSRSSGGTCSKVSPKPMSADAEKGGGPERTLDREFWWNKHKFKETSRSSVGSSKSSSIGSSKSGSIGSSKSGSIGSSCSNSSLGSGRKMRSWYSFFRPQRSKAQGT